MIYLIEKAFPYGKASYEKLFLANLIAYRAGSLASRLAGCLALAAAAFCSSFFQVSLI